MRRRGDGFLLVELIVALSIFSGVLAVMLLALQTMERSVGLDMERTHAACRLERLLEEVRRGLIPLGPRPAQMPITGSLATAPPSAQACLPTEKWVIRYEPWSAEPGLHKVTATVEWWSRRRREESMSAVTLVRTERLKFAGEER